VVSYVSKAKRVEPEDMENILFRAGGEEMRTVFDKWREEGMQQGIQQGFYKGLLEDSREAVIEALEVKFGEVKPHISQKIKRIENRDLLKALHKAAIKANSMEEFEQRLKGQAN
jgi:hypothetical protein